MSTHHDIFVIQSQDDCIAKEQKPEEAINNLRIYHLQLVQEC